YVPCPDDNSPYVWGFYEKIDVSVSVDVDIKVEVPVVVTVIPTTAARTDVPTNTAAVTGTSNIVVSESSTSTASETASTDAELCSSIPSYTPGVVYAVGYDTTAEDFEYVASGGYRSAVSTPLDASLDSSGIIVQGTTYQPLVELMFFASGTFEISQLVSNTDSAYGYIFVGQFAMTCSDIKEIGTGGQVYNGSLDGGWNVNAEFSGQWYPIRVVASEAIGFGRKRQVGQLTVGMSGQYDVVGELAQSSTSSVSSVNPASSLVSFSSVNPSTKLSSADSSIYMDSTKSSNLINHTASLSSAASTYSVIADSSLCLASSLSSEVFSTVHSGSSSSSVTYSVPSSESSSVASSESSSSSSSVSSSSSSSEYVDVYCTVQPSGKSSVYHRVVYTGVDISSYTPKQVANGDYRTAEISETVSVFINEGYTFLLVGTAALDVKEVMEVTLYVQGPNMLLNVSQTTGDMPENSFYAFVGPNAMDCTDINKIGTGGYSSSTPGGSDSWSIYYDLSQADAWYPIRVVASPVFDFVYNIDFQIYFESEIIAIASG
ncbi:hypothetical protein CANCADRAFT_30793, partial [Tortispora caseinolytica NRRL Y-17796]